MRRGLKRISAEPTCRSCQKNRRLAIFFSPVLPVVSLSFPVGSVLADTSEKDAPFGRITQELSLTDRVPELRGKTE